MLSFTQASDTPSGSDTDSEWQGIQQEDGTEQTEGHCRLATHLTRCQPASSIDLFPNSEFDGLSQHDGAVFVFTIFARISTDHE